VASVGFELLAALPSFAAPLWNVLLLLVGVFLILLVLIQRGKGGGVSGMLGGAGGSSAFGSRAGDTFTKVTIYVALAWIFMIMVMIKMIQPTTSSEERPSAAQNVPTPPAEGPG
jgi:preprotein translocase subunit SecG